MKEWRGGLNDRGTNGLIVHGVLLCCSVALSMLFMPITLMPKRPGWQEITISIAISVGWDESNPPNRIWDVIYTIEKNAQMANSGCPGW